MTLMRSMDLLVCIVLKKECSKKTELTIVHCDHQLKLICKTRVFFIFSVLLSFSFSMNHTATKVNTPFVSLATFCFY
mgnify:CR=1 FL=1